MLSILHTFSIYLCIAFCFITVFSSTTKAEGLPLLIGLSADLSSGSAKSGMAIRRGVQLALDEVNRAGGVLGRPLKLHELDHRGNPQRGIEHIRQLSKLPDLVAVMGGLHTPVALQQLPMIKKKNLLFLLPWAAGTPLVDNGLKPNPVFRISVRDADAGPYLVEKMMERGFRRPALLLERTAWGRSNRRAMLMAMARLGIEPVSIRWFLWGSREFSTQLQEIRKVHADVILMVANAPEGSAITRAMAELPKEERLPILSHWGITGGRFYQQSADVLDQVDLQFLQTFSFLNPPFEGRATKLAHAYRNRYGLASSDPIPAPVGTAHAYDLTHLLAKAISQAGDSQVSAVRQALESLERHEGVVKNYIPPFTPTQRDALESQDYQLAVFGKNGAIIPVERTYE
ncbi:ABC transporter substrate-binding protein [Magnetococcus sp. PR-3]|uniref:ABC transporter substrate-binding protein n=1 Tax=Magnetococcus sp. PR-3 TaxID=3120355 RepID=UPI002FCDF09C